MNNNKKSEKLSEENKSKSLFFFIFEKQERKKEKIENRESSFNRCTITLIIINVFIAGFSLIILNCFNDKIKTECGIRFLLFLLFGSVLVITVVSFFSDLKKIFNSVSKFIFYGTSIFFVVSLCFYALLLVITNNAIIPFYIMIFLMVLLWSYISTLYDLEVAKIANSIISAIVTLVLGFTDNLKSTILVVKPVTDDSKILSLIKAIVFNDNALKFFLFPLVTATLIGLISCEYKEYWIKRNGIISDSFNSH